MIARIQHVSIPHPVGSDDEVRAFYGELLSFEEIPPPASLEGVIWYRLGETELHLFADDGEEEPSRRHLCVEVGDVEALRERLAGAGVETRDATPIPGRPRFFCRDPFGNRLEFTQILGDYRKGI